MGTRLIAVFAGLLLTLLLSSPGFATQEPRSVAVASAAQGPVAADALAMSPGAAGAAAAWREDEPGLAEAEVEVEGSMDLPDLVQQLSGAGPPAPCRVRPAPHRIALWRAPVLDGLRRPPRQAKATA